MRKRRPKGYGSVQKIAGSVYARWTEAGIDYRRPAGSEREAEELLAYVAATRKRHGLTLLSALDRVDAETAPQGAQRTPARPTFEYVLDAYLDACDRKGDLRETTRKTNRQRGYILRSAPWASRPLEDLNHREIRAWVTERQAKGASGKTCVNDLGLASSVFTFADDEELIDLDAVNPFLRARPKRFKRKQRRALEPHPYLVLADAVRTVTTALWPLFLATHFSGWRGGELCELREADVDLGDDPRMKIDGSREKTGKDKDARISEPLVSILRAERGGRPRLPSAFVFTNEVSRPWTRKARLLRLRKALATVPLEIIPAWQREPSETHLGLDWHSLRHTVRNIMDSRGHREVVIGETMGQSDPGTVRRYSHAYQTEARAMAADLSAFIIGTSGKQEASGS